MGEKQHIQKYLVHFNKLSQLMGWNSLALQKVFYNGLPERIQITPVKGRIDGEKSRAMIWEVWVGVWSCSEFRRKVQRTIYFTATLLRCRVSIPIKTG
jgi:hypothetical protein